MMILSVGTSSYLITMVISWGVCYHGNLDLLALNTLYLFAIDHKFKEVQ